MDEKKIENTLRNFVDSLERHDIERALSLFSEDAVWHAVGATFNGKDEIRKYLNFIVDTFKDLKFKDYGIGILVKGNKAAFQFSYEGLYNGINIKSENISTSVFDEEKIKNYWSLNDRLSLAQQVATGPIAKKVVNSIIVKSEKGLH